MRKSILSLIVVGVLTSNLYAGFFSNCFDCKNSTMEIAQQIRQEAKDMNWDIGKIKSISIAGIIKGKKVVFPDGDMEVCLKEKDGDLEYIMKSSSSDATRAKWHFLSSSKKGWF